MFEKDSKAWTHYFKLQETLSELMDPGFSSQARSFALITLNQTYTHTERLFELAEESVTLSRPRQAILAKLAHHIENTKDRGMSRDFIQFLQTDLHRSLGVIRDLFQKDFDLAS
ncbi:MAG: hypothetical protein EOP10_07670 [Proteobacteria bacterium]|nr:MAG: hypothetical protein EOP10_07670 [Pseudomonadota bacterium]